MLPRNIFRLSVYLAVAAYLSSANADPTQESKAEAAPPARLSAKISEKNPDGTWISGAEPHSLTMFGHPTRFALNCDGLASRPTMLQLHGIT